MEEVTVLHISSNLSIDVVRKDIKYMHLAVYPPSGRVRIAVPLHVNDEAVRLFAISKIGWIRKHQRNFESQDRQSPREFKAHESHYFQGKRYLLRIFEANSPAKIEIKTKTYIDLYIKPGSSKEKKQKVINDWYRAELKIVLPDIIQKWEEIIGIRLYGWQIRQMKNKWGTCSVNEKKIRINLELAKKPVVCLEYIVVHEMIHLLERRHNERFISLMQKYLPQWKFYKKELNAQPVSHGEWAY